MVYDDIDMFATSCIKGHIHVIKGHIHVIIGLCNIQMFREKSKNI